MQIMANHLREPTGPPPFFEGQRVVRKAFIDIFLERHEPEHGWEVESIAWSPRDSEWEVRAVNPMGHHMTCPASMLEAEGGANE